MISSAILILEFCISAIRIFVFTILEFLFFSQTNKSSKKKSSPQWNEFICESNYCEAITLGWAREGAKRQCHIAVSHLLFFPCSFPFVGNEHNEPLFPKPKATIMQIQRRAHFLHRSAFISGLSDQEARELSEARGRKRESWAKPEEGSDKFQHGAQMPGQRRAGQLVKYRTHGRI